MLYRNGYGENGWTKIEQTAFRNRAFDQGYDFVFLIPLDNPVIPAWFPKYRIWNGIDHWGIEAAAPMIEARVQEFDGVVKNLSTADKAAIAQRNKREQQRRQSILDSKEGLNLAFNEMQVIKTILDQLTEELLQKTSGWPIRSRPNNNSGYDVISYGRVLTFQFRRMYNNSLSESYLYVGLIEGYVDENFRNPDPFHTPKELLGNRYQFDISELDQNGWSDFKTRKKFITSKRLVEEVFDKFIQNAGQNS